MRVFNDVKFLFYFTYLRNLWEDYPQNHNIIDFNEASCKNISVFTTGFFIGYNTMRYARGKNSFSVVKKLLPCYYINAWQQKYNNGRSLS